MMNIPLLDLKSEYQIIKKDLERQFKICLRTQNWILSDPVKQLEEKIARYLGVRHAIGVASGTDALILSLRALALQRKKKQWFSSKDEIITSPFTFIATAESIVYAGAKPVFVDIDPRTYNIDPRQVKKAITRNTVGMIPVHLYGMGCDMGSLCSIARKHNLFIVEDAAQCFGAEYRGKPLGSFGDFGAFSFFPSKNLGAYGDGGMIATNKDSLAKEIKILRNHGQTKQYHATYIGYNSRLDAIHSAVLLAKLKHIDQFNQMRNTVAKKYTARLKKIPYITVPQVGKEQKHVYHLYTIGVSQWRDELLEYLNKRGIAARQYYPALLSAMPAFRRARRKTPLTCAEGAVRSVLSLPLHPFMKERQIDFVISSVEAFFKKKNT